MSLRTQYTFTDFANELRVLLPGERTTTDDNHSNDPLVRDLVTCVFRRLAAWLAGDGLDHGPNGVLARGDFRDPGCSCSGLDRGSRLRNWKRELAKYVESHAEADAAKNLAEFVQVRLDAHTIAILSFPSCSSAQAARRVV